VHNIARLQVCWLHFIQTLVIGARKYEQGVVVNGLTYFDYPQRSLTIHVGLTNVVILGYQIVNVKSGRRQSSRVFTQIGHLAGHHARILSEA